MIFDGTTVKPPAAQRYATKGRLHFHIAGLSGAIKTQVVEQALNHPKGDG